MPYTKLTLKEAASFLHLSVEDLQYLAGKGDIPCFQEKGRLMFRKHEIKDWATHKILNISEKTGTRRFGRSPHAPRQIWSLSEEEGVTLQGFIQVSALEPNLPARTKTSLLKELVLLAEKTCLVANPPLLLQLLRDREELQSTGLPGGLAFPHPRIHPPDLFHDSFFCVARIRGGLPFGSSDGELSDLFFMPCAKDDADHIFMLSRLAALLKKTDLADALRGAGSISDMEAVLREKEQSWLTSRSRSAGQKVARRK